VKILEIAPLWASVPPQAYGGTELIVSEVTDGMVKLGHDVTLFASGDSKTVAHLNSIVAEALGEKVESGEMGPDEVIKNEVFSNFKAFLEAGKYDVIHAHSNYLGSAFANFVSVPCVATLHYYPKGPEYEIMKQSKAYFISISNKFREFAPEVKFFETVYNGIDISDYEFKKSNIPEHLISISRVSPKKGLGESIEAALKAEKSLKIAGPLPKKAENDKSWLVDEPYFNERIEPYLNKDGIDHIGEFPKEQKSDFFRAKALLFPLQWEEPFGLTIVEAMACGTPVIAFARGSIPEIIEDGKTGFIVNSSEEDRRGDWVIKESGIGGIVEAIKKLYALSDSEYQVMRENSRKRVEENFTIEKMVSGYEAVYKKAIEDFKAKQPE